MSAFKPPEKTDEELAEAFTEGFVIGIRTGTKAMTEALDVVKDVITSAGLAQQFYDKFSSILDDSKDLPQKEFEEFMIRFSKNHALRSRTISRRRP